MKWFWSLSFLLKWCFLEISPIPRFRFDAIAQKTQNPWKFLPFNQFQRCLSNLKIWHYTDFSRFRMDTTKVFFYQNRAASMIIVLNTLFVQIVCGRINYGTNFFELNLQKILNWWIYFCEFAKSLGICGTNFCKSKTNLKK